MKNSDIKYKNLSTDYERLHKLLKYGYVLVGFVENDKSEEYSKLVEIRYISKHKCFDAWGRLHEQIFSKEEIIEIWRENNVRYFDIN